MNATRLPAGGPDDLEQLLRSELGAVADAVGSDGRPAPASAVLARGRAVRRRRRTAVSAGAALATVAVLAIGFAVSPVNRADGGPAVPLPTVSLPAATAQEIVDWVQALPVGPVPGLPFSSEGVVAFGTTSQKLPEVKGLSRFAYGFGTSSRGMLVGRPPDTSGGTTQVRLGWLAADGGWTVVDTLDLRNAMLSPDGEQYVVLAGPVVPDPQARARVVVRGVADDVVLTEVDVPSGTDLKGWFDGGWLLTAEDGTRPMVLRGDTLEPRDGLVPVAPTGEPVVAVTSVRGGDVVEYSLPNLEGCPTVDGSPSARRMADRYENGTRVDRVDLGCQFADFENVSPDGRWFVGGLDELTVRDLATGRPVGPVGPRPPAGSTVANWEPDGTHVQIEVSVTTPELEFRRVVRCSVVDGTCVRNV